MIDGLIAFYRSGFDAQVYCLCMGGFTAIGIVTLRQSTGYNGFISRLARQIAYLTMQAGIGLLLVALVRYIGGCLEDPDCSIIPSMRVSVMLTVATAISFGPMIYLWVLSRLPRPTETLEEEKPVLRLPAPETFADKGTAP